MSYGTLFLGEINGENQLSLSKKIDYKKTNLEDRKKIVDNILESGFYEDYFDEFYKSNLNSTDSLSENNNICNSLENMATYLLNSDEAKEDKKNIEYKFYTNEENFQAALKREAKIDSMGTGLEKDNIIHFLKTETKNYKKTKTQRITKKDLSRNDELGKVLNNYNDFLKIVTKKLKSDNGFDVSRYLLTKTSGSLKEDMINSKDILLGVFGYKTNTVETATTDWDLVDYTNPEHVKALLYFQPNYHGNEDLKYIIIDFNKIIKGMKFSKLQRQIIRELRNDQNIVGISKRLNVTRVTIYKNLNSIITRICNQAKRMS